MEVRENMWDVNADTFENIKEIVPAEGLALGIEKRLFKRVKRIVELGAFLPGNMNTTSGDFLLVVDNDQVVHILFSSLDFEFNGKERQVQTVPVALKLMRKPDGTFKVIDMYMDDQWRKVFMIPTPTRRKGLLPGRDINGREVMKMIASDSLRAIVDRVADNICSKVEYIPTGEDNVPEEMVNEIAKRVLARIREEVRK